MRIYVLDGGGPKDSENTLNSFLIKRGEKVFWQIGAEMTSKILDANFNTIFWQQLHTLSNVVYLLFRNDSFEDIEMKVCR